MNFNDVGMVISGTSFFIGIISILVIWLVIK